MDAKKILGTVAPKITKEMLEVIAGERARIKNKYEYIDEVWLKIIDLAMGGKKLRGAFTYFSYLMYSKGDEKDALKASVLLELIHLYALIIDDFQDKSSLRRGVPTIHSLYGSINKNELKISDPLHFGNSIAVCAGMMVNHLAFNFFSELDFPKQRLLQAIAKINEQVVDTVYGQILDIIGESKTDVTEKYALDVVLLKSAKYTYECPLLAGAILAGAPEQELKILSDYAIPAGIAFQIQDDILGMFGEEGKLGKSTKSDIIEGKKTILIVKALELASDKDRFFIKNHLRNADITDNDIDAVKNIIANSGSLEYAKKLCKDLVNKAQISLSESEYKDTREWNFLNGVAEYMIKRNH